MFCGPDSDLWSFHGTNVWANNARDLIGNGIASLQEVISSREDIFLHLMNRGIEPAHSFAIAERVRKGIPLTQEDIDAMKAADIPDWYINSCAKITYLFPKAHAAAYVMNAFRIAYFKVHYPVVSPRHTFPFTVRLLAHP